MTKRVAASAFIGAIVHVFARGIHRPAIVLTSPATPVFGAVDVHVFGSGAPPTGPNDEVLTNVAFDDTLNPGEHTWHWPEPAEGE